jgi:hypothetical protein
MIGAVASYEDKYDERGERLKASDEERVLYSCPIGPVQNTCYRTNLSDVLESTGYQRNKIKVYMLAV